MQEADGAVQMRARGALGLGGWGRVCVCVKLEKDLPWSSSYHFDLGAGGDSEKDLSLW